MHLEESKLRGWGWGEGREAGMRDKVEPAAESGRMKEKGDRRMLNQLGLAT